MYKRMTVDVNGKRGDEPGFDKENVAVYGLAMNVDQWYIYVPMVLAEGGSVRLRRPLDGRCSTRRPASRPSAS